MMYVFHAYPSEHQLWLNGLERKSSEALPSPLRWFINLLDQYATGVHFVVITLGAYSGLTGLFLLQWLIDLHGRQYFSVLTIVGFWIWFVLWLGLMMDAVMHLGITAKLRKLLQPIDSWQGKTIVYFFGILGGAFTYQWDTVITIVDPLMFVSLSLSWSCALRAIQLHADSGIQLTLLLAASMRALRLYSLDKGAPWAFFCYSFTLGALRFFFDSRDVKEPIKLITLQQETKEDSDKIIGKTVEEQEEDSEKIITYRHRKNQLCEDILGKEPIELITLQQETKEDSDRILGKTVEEQEEDSEKIIAYHHRKNQLCEDVLGKEDSVIDISSEDEDKEI